MFGAEFDVPSGYLNTPGVGIPSRSIADAVDATVQRWRSGGDQGPDFDDAVMVSRAGFAELIGVDVDRVAIGSAVAQLVSMVAAGLPDGSRVLTADAEFTSVTFPFAEHADRGITVTEVPLARLPDLIDGYDLLAVSIVQSSDGSIVDLDAIRAASSAAGVPVLLDATQAVGWQPMSLEWADWVVAAGYKWLLCPRGAAWLSVHPRSLARTKPLAANWYAGQDRWNSVYGLPLRQACAARRLDLSPVWFSHIGAATALSYLASLDLVDVRAHCVGLADGVLKRLGRQERDSAIISLDIENAAERLARAGVKGSVRAGRVRLGFHIYNTEEDAELVMHALS